MAIFFFLISCKTDTVDKERRSLNNRYANNFEIIQLDSALIVDVRQTHKSATKSIRYLLHPRGSDIPDVIYDQSIEVPLKRVAVTSTVDMAFMVKLGLLDRIVAVSDTGYIFNQALKENVAKGLVKQIQYQQVMDYELLIKESPEVIFMQQIDDGSTSEKLKELGIPIVYTADYLENSLLGRAEWIKMIAAFFQLDSHADSIYATIEKDYKDQLELVKVNKIKRPKVLTGAVYEGIWYIAGGRSLTAKGISDAGGDYIWADNEQTGGVPYSFEKVFSEAAEADIWINVSNYESKGQMLTENEKYSLFKPYSEAVMYNYYKRKTSSGGSDVFESAIVEPNLLLRDYIHMFTGQDSILRYYELMTP